MRKLRVSAISYLNTAPLIWDFEHGERGKQFQISYTLPSVCARALSEGNADIGIIPSAAYAQIPGLLVIPDVAIASRQPVRSILLVSNTGLDDVRTVALDTSSMTSVTLTKILFEKYWGGGRQYVSMPPKLDVMLSKCDAALLIGDPALQIDRSRYVTLDLAEEWIRATGKPFVFAFWAARGEALREADPAIDLGKIFRESRDHGLEAASLTHIAREWAPRVKLSPAEVCSYLTENIHYRLDADCLEGLNLFYRYANDIGAVQNIPKLRFLETDRQAAGAETHSFTV